MIRGLARLVLLRFLPRRLLPVLTAWEVVQLVRNRRRERAQHLDARDVSASAARPSTRSSRRSK